MLPVQKKKLRAQKANPIRALGKRLGGLRGQFDIALQRDRHAIERRGAQRQDRPEAGPINLVFGSALLNLRKQIGIGIHHQHAGIAVNDHEIIVANQARRIGQPDDCWFRQASCHDRCVRGCTPQFDREGAGVTPKQQIGRCGFGRDHHERVERLARPWVLNRVAQQGA